MDTYYVDGRFVDDGDAFISAKDLTVLRGFGVFDFLRTYNKRPFYLKEHVERLRNSAKHIGLAIKESNTDICSIVEETLKKNTHNDESNIRIVYTGGISSDGVTPQGNGKLMVMVTHKHELPESWYTKGAKIITVDVERFIPESKSTSYLPAIFALQKAGKAGAVEAIYVDRNKRILEGTTTNFFYFKGSKLITSQKGILPGITRGVVMNLAKKHFDVEVRDIKFSELSKMQEVFITASNKEIVPVIKINAMKVSDGKPGKNTRLVMELFRDYTTKYGQGLE